MQDLFRLEPIYAELIFSHKYQTRHVVRNAKIVKPPVSKIVKFVHFLLFCVSMAKDLDTPILIFKL